MTPGCLFSRPLDGGHFLATGFNPWRLIRLPAHTYTGDNLSMSTPAQTRRKQTRPWTFWGAFALTCLAALGSEGRAQTPAAPASAADSPLIIPRPKSVAWTGSRLSVDSSTRLVLALGAGRLDRMAALSVQHELHERFGLPLLPIRTATVETTGVAIVFGEPERSAWVRRGLQAWGAHPSHRSEGYELVAGSGGAVVAGHDPAGTFYGAQTLCQMLRRDAHGVYVPGGWVDDYPTLGWRGAHLFVGDRALPFHRKLIARVFARLKMNALVLECEQARWETLGRAAPSWAMSKADLKAEVAFARRYGMTVTPLVNSVGHMPWAFAGGANTDLAEDPQTPYAARVADPRTDRFLFRLYDEVLDTFGASALHLGGDEVALRGRYPYLSRAQFPTLADAFVAQVTRAHDHLKARGVRTLLWGDMLLASGEAADAASAPSAAQARQMRERLPHDIVLTDWHYRASGPFASLRPLRAAGFGPIIGATWFEPGNIAGFSQALGASREKGLLQTTWAGFNSSEANLTHEKRQFTAFVLAAECAWNGGGVDAGRLPYDPAQVFDRLYGPRTPAPPAPKPPKLGGRRAL